jgi:hypothetical protein
VSFKEALQDIAEHFVLVALAIIGSLLLALIVIGGIYVLNLVASKNYYIELLVNYSGIEGVGIFILGSIGLIRRIFAAEPDDEAKDDAGTGKAANSGSNQTPETDEAS